MSGRLPRCLLLYRVREVREMIMRRNVVVMSLHRGACFKLPLTRPSVRLRERGDSRCIWVTADKLQLLSRDQKSGIAALARSSKQLNVNATTTRRIKPCAPGSSWSEAWYLGFGPSSAASPLAGSEEVELFSFAREKRHGLPGPKPSESRHLARARKENSPPPVSYPS